MCEAVQVRKTPDRKLWAVCGLMSAGRAEEEHLCPEPPALNSVARAASIGWFQHSI